MKLPEPKMKCVNGYSRMHYTIYCRQCGEPYDFPKPKYVRKNKDGVVESQLSRAMTANGWRPGSGCKSWTCPACINPPRIKEIEMKPKADPPRESTPSDRRKVADLLEEVYDADRQIYKDAESDDTVATTLGVPRKWVADVRELLFGQYNRNEKGETRNKELDQLEARLAAERARIDELAAVVKAMRL